RGGVANFAFRFRQRFALFQRHQTRQIVLMFHHQIEPATQDIGMANDVAKLTKTGKALYSGMLNASGGVIDDLIVYYFTEDFFRLV
ncbi:hypothetical protein MJL48_30060, partial [Salmonella enterica subsp. enterica serovar Kentucky]|nr:hypothetical protein [Salmonella enterica subsp. enterica serovar Kentucky]